MLQAALSALICLTRCAVFVLREVRKDLPIR